jgi:hypothetical protein
MREQNPSPGGENGRARKREADHREELNAPQPIREGVCPSRSLNRIFTCSSKPSSVSICHKEA